MHVWTLNVKSQCHHEKREKKYHLIIHFSLLTFRNNKAEGRPPPLPPTNPSPHPPTFPQNKWLAVSALTNRRKWKHRRHVTRDKRHRRALGETMSRACVASGSGGRPVHEAALYQRDPFNRQLLGGRAASEWDVCRKRHDSSANKPKQRLFKHCFPDQAVKVN